MGMKELSAHYGIEEKQVFPKCCLPVLSFFQVFDTILVREGLHMTTAAVVPDSAGAPGAQVAVRD